MMSSRHTSDVWSFIPFLAPLTPFRPLFPPGTENFMPQLKDSFSPVVLPHLEHLEHFETFGTIGAALEQN